MSYDDRRVAADMSPKSAFITGTCPVNCGPTFDFREASPWPCQGLRDLPYLFYRRRPPPAQPPVADFPMGSVKREKIAEGNTCSREKLFFVSSVRFLCIFMLFPLMFLALYILILCLLRFSLYNRGKWEIDSESLCLTTYNVKRFFVNPSNSRTKGLAFGKPATVTDHGPCDRMCPLRDAAPFSASRSFPPTPAASFLSFRRY